MKRGRTLAIAGGIASIAVMLLAGCQPETERPASAPETPATSAPNTPETSATSEPDTSEATAAEAAAEPEVKNAFDIDIGDITYGVFASIEFHNDDIRPNIDVERLSSPRFDQRTQSLTVNIRPPHPAAVPMLIILGSTRYLTEHTVRIRTHVYRQYDNASGEQVTEEIRTFDQILGEERFVLQPYTEKIDAFAGLAEKPATMLLFCELEAWLFRFTDVTTFDPAAADYSSVPYKKYSGFNPARINLVQLESQE